MTFSLTVPLTVDELDELHQKIAGQPDRSLTTISMGIRSLRMKRAALRRRSERMRTELSSSKIILSFVYLALFNRSQAGIEETPKSYTSDSPSNYEHSP